MADDDIDCLDLQLKGPPLPVAPTPKAQVAPPPTLPIPLPAPIPVPNFPLPTSTSPLPVPPLPAPPLPAPPLPTPLHHTPLPTLPTPLPAPTHTPLPALPDKKPFPLYTLPDATQSDPDVVVIKHEPVERIPVVPPPYVRPEEVKARPDPVFSQFMFSQTPSCMIVSPPTRDVVCKPSPEYLAENRQHTSLFSSAPRTSKLFELPSEIRELSEFKYDMGPPPMRDPPAFSQRDFVPPPTRAEPVHHSQHFELQKVPVEEGAKQIPGPAGEFRKRNGEPIDVEERPPGPEQDEDFRKGPWLAVLHRLKISLCDNPGSPAALLSSVEGQQAFSCNTQQLQEGGGDKAPTLALLVKSVTFWNDNACATFKDPWGTIEGSVHAKVWKQFPQLAAGSAVLLSNVTVFTPHSGNHYLNVVVANVREVYRTSTPLASFGPAKASFPPPHFVPSDLPPKVESDLPFFPSSSPAIPLAASTPSPFPSTTYVDHPSFPTPSFPPYAPSAAPSFPPVSAPFPLSSPPCFPSTPARSFPFAAPSTPSPTTPLPALLPPTPVPVTPLPALLPPTPLPSSSSAASSSFSSCSSSSSCFSSSQEPDSKKQRIEPAIVEEDDVDKLLEGF